jgi:hypothetical protein
MEEESIYFGCYEVFKVIFEGEKWLEGEQGRRFIDGFMGYYVCYVVGEINVGMDLNNGDKWGRWYI